MSKFSRVSPPHNNLKQINGLLKKLFLNGYLICLSKVMLETVTVAIFEVIGRIGVKLIGI